MEDDPLGDRVTPFELPRRRLARGTGDTTAAPPAPPRGCTCPGAPGADPRTYCLCGRNPMLTGAWILPAPGDGARARFVRPLDPAARLLRVRGSGDVTLGHLLPVRAGDVGSVAGHWSLEVAVLARPGEVDVWWRGYPFAIVRQAARLPWLERLAARHPVTLIDGDQALRVVDAFEHLRAEPLELLVSR